MYIDLFLTFARIGLFTFGGGYAMLPILQREVVDSKKWISETELTDYYSIGQCTPGVIAINVATFVGYKLKGIKGAICSTAGMVFPSLVIIIIIATSISQFADLVIVQHALSGIRVAVCALVAHTIIKLTKSGVTDKTTLAILIATFALVAFFGVSPVIIVIGCAIVGVLRKGLIK